MNSMNKDELKAFLNRPYPGTEDFLQHIIFPIFGQDKFVDEYEKDYLDEPSWQKKAEAAGISHIYTLGHIKAGKPIHLFDVTVSDHVRMARNRVSLQLIIRDILKSKSGSAGAFMVFRYEDSRRHEWRFSFCYKAHEDEKSTDAKRFTFLFGPNHSCRTAAENFLKLFQQNAEGQRVKVGDIQDAFSVEALSEEFFDKYREHYAQFVLHATGKQANKWEEDTEHAPDEAIMQAFGGDEKRVRDYVKKLLGRIVFLHFLQKKGWMGVPDGGRWGAGKLQFMSELFREATAEQQADFVHEVLEHLFFHALNTDRKADNDLYDTRVFGEKVRVPYLNGGLFEEDDADRCFKACTNAHFPAELFRELFTFFEQYNFTIDENDPDDAQVGVDPEMLGRIFESLLEDNKEKGAFYTPKEIVQYMCRRSLTAYLQADVPDERMRKKIDEFIRTKDYDCFHVQDDVPDERMPKAIDECVCTKDYDGLRQQIAERLRTVKICDPAIGSGAFPMGLLRELYLCRIALEDGVRENRAKSHAEIKKEILQQNIYGVDLDRGAVDIARLRFWLSLVVDEDVPQPLPNLDYKIMQGNSLLERYKDIDLSTLASQKTDGRLFFIDDENDASRLSLHHLLVAYYGEDNHDKKQSLRSRIQQNIEEQLKAQRYEVDLSDVDLFANAHFFLWHTWFSEVFSRPTKEGFNIVIGNPPYGAKLSDEDKRTFKKTYRSAQTIKGKQKGSLDTYSLFIEQGYNLLNKGGCLAMIVPLSITSSDSLSGLHQLLFSKCDDIHISSYAVRPKPVFENAVVNTSIVSLRKTLSPMQHIYATKMYRRGKGFDLQKLIDNLTFAEVKGFLLNGRIPKISFEIEKAILRKLFRLPKLGSIMLSHGSPIIYRFAGGRYFKVVTNYSNGSSAERTIYFADSKIADAVGCILSSNLSFWFYQIFSDNLNWKTYEIEHFNIPHLTSENLAYLDDLYALYLMDIEAKANVRTTSGKSAYNVDSFKEYKIGRSKAIIDRIDDYICPLYGLTKEETEFIKNYEIEFRLGKES